MSDEQFLKAKNAKKLELEAAEHAESEIAKFKKAADMLKSWKTTAIYFEGEGTDGPAFDGRNVPTLKELRKVFDEWRQARAVTESYFGYMQRPEREMIENMKLN